MWIEDNKKREERSHKMQNNKLTAEIQYVLKIYQKCINDFMLLNEIF